MDGRMRTSPAFRRSDVEHKESISVGTQCQSFMLPQYEASGIGLVPHLQRTTKCIEQDSKEEQGASAVKTPRIEGQVVENASDNQCHDKVPDHA
jgi:hypothetical protein